MTNTNYYPPQIDILEVETEQGIAASGIGNEGFGRQAAYDLYLNDED